MTAISQKTGGTIGGASDAIAKDLLKMQGEWRSKWTIGRDHRDQGADEKV